MCVFLIFYNRKRDKLYNMLMQCFEFKHIIMKGKFFEIITNITALLKISEYFSNLINVFLVYN